MCVECVCSCVVRTEVMSDLVKNVFDADINGNVNVYRQYLQTSFVKTTAQLLENPALDQVSKSAVFYTLKKLKTKLTTAAMGNEETKAHRANMVFIIEKALKTD